MALISDNTELSLGISSWLGKAQRVVGAFFSPPAHSPEYALLSGPLRDARLAPRVPMNNAEIDVGLLTQLSSIGLKRGKQVTEASHPELMQAWNAMAKRAGMDKAPQLIIAESDTLNALTVNKQEVVITTGLLKILDLREAVAVLGHELGHVQSDHTTARMLWSGGLAGIGAFAGNEFGRHGGANMLMHHVGNKLPLVEKLRGLLYPKPYVNSASSLIGYSAYIAAGVSMGAMVGRHLSVHPTELDADAKGAAISGDPAGLANALETLQRHVPNKGLKRSMAQVSSGYPTMAKRVKQLNTMAASGGYSPVIHEVDQRVAQSVASHEPTHTPAPAVHGAASAGRVAPASELGLS